jgi:hypothetical protein
MSAIDTRIGAQKQAHDVTHQPSSGLPYSNVWDAIQAVRALLPTSSVDNTVPRFDGIAGALQSSGVSIDDSNGIHAVSLALLSGAAGTSASLSIGRTFADGVLAVAGATNAVLNGSVAGDVMLVASGAGKKLWLGNQNSGIGGLYVDDTGRVTIGTDDAVGEVGTCLFKAVTDTFVIAASTVGGQQYPILILRNRDDTPSGGPGGSIYWQGYNTTGGLLSACILNAGLVTATAGAEDSLFDLKGYRNGVADRVLLTVDADQDRICSGLDNVFKLGDTGARFTTGYFSTSLVVGIGIYAVTGFSVTSSNAWAITVGGTARFSASDAGVVIGTPTGSAVDGVINAAGAYRVNGNLVTPAAAGTDGQIVVGQTSATPLWKSLSGDITINASGVTAVGNNKITDAMLRQGVARSVIGVTGNATANVADIQGTSDQVLRVNSAGNALAFGQLLLSSGNAVTGTLGAGNGGTGVSSLGNISKTDDTNVTLALGGTPAGAVINSTSFTLGWTGQLSVARGGTGLASGTSGGILAYTAAGALASSAALAANAIVVGGGAGVVPLTPATTPPTISSTGVITVANATASTTTGTGALIVTGGIGVAKKVFAASLDVAVGVPDATHGFTIGGVAAIKSSSGYFGFYDAGGANTVFEAGISGTDSTNYYSHTTHAFRNTGGGVTYARITSAGFVTNTGTLMTSTADLTNGAGTGSGVTFANAPGSSGSTGNPTKWLPVNDNGTIRYLPAF